MAEAEEKVADQLREITECPICISEFSDPRILPCIHTFCFECLKRTSEAVYKNPGDKMPCPLCRKDFVIPEDGVSGVQKNFFMQNLLNFKATTEIGSDAIICDMCNVRNDGKIKQISKASMRCLECQDNYCERCVKVHQFQKVTKHHQMVKIESDIKPVTTGLVSMKSCSKHIHKLLDCYCTDCKKIVCVSCFAESHASHKCKDVTIIEEEFHQTIERKASKISTYRNEMLSMRNNNEKRIADFIKEIADKEKEIHKRNKELKDMMDRHTKSLLDELLVIKYSHLKKMEIGMDEIDRHCTILGSFEAYCTELRLRGSVSDICSSFDELILRSDELERDHKAFSSCPPHKSIEVSFQSTDLSDVLQNADSNLVGKVEDRFKMSPEEQKQMLGEHLYPLIQKQMLGSHLYPLIHTMYPNLAGKITAMLLELDSWNFPHLLEDRKVLKIFVERAMSVLQAHQAEEAAKKDDDQMLLNDSN